MSGLIVARRPGERIFIGDDIIIKAGEIINAQARLFIDTPCGMPTSSRKQNPEFAIRAREHHMLNDVDDKQTVAYERLVSGDKIMLGTDITITVHKIREGSVRLQIEAPKDVTIAREEVRDRIANLRRESHGT